ncbi:MAG: cytochrome c biogenesis protein ResB [Bacteroidales bacterium]|jgi:hypothetical protein|nr:cytochrome c biogenesis protein ResB [Bacteroidales bacterium]
MKAERLYFVAFVFLAILTIIMAIATLLEPQMGTNFIRLNIYDTCWFVALWGITALLSFFISLKLRIYKKIPVFLLHISFIIILIGAFLTYLTAQRGTLHLRTDASAVSNNIEIPFDIQLQKFETQYYTGTHTPSDFVSYITVKDKNNFTENAAISMNHIYKHRGYRFYQSNYDSDGKGSILSVSFDPYGTTITYIGYASLLFSFIWLGLWKWRQAKGN